MASTGVLLVAFVGSAALTGLASPSATPTPQIYRAGGGVTPPRVIRKVDAQVPEECKTGHQFDGGLCVFEAVITEDGDVRDVHAVRSPKISPPCPELLIAQRKAIQQWKYEPARRKGKPVAVYLTVTVLIHFR